MNIKVKKVNAFTDSTEGGNPAGVVLDSPVLNEKQMAYVSKVLNVSETAFVFPSKKADFKTRFFTPTIEVDLCGHATIATFFTMALENKFQYKKNITVTQETTVGVLPIDIEFSNDKELERVMMHQSKPVIKNVKLDLDVIAGSLNISVDEIDDSIPKQIVSTGLFTLPVCVKSFNVLKRINPDFQEVENLCNKLGVGSFHVFTFETVEEKSAYHARNFPPLYGINEDPVTGTANGAVCSYLTKSGIVKNHNLICEQGDIIGRPGRVFVEVDNSVVKVGGRAKIVEKLNLEIY